MQRLQHGHRHHGRAVRVGDYALRDRIEGVTVDLRHHERHLGVHPPRGGVVDHNGTLRGNFGGQGPRGCRAGGEQGDVETGEISGIGILDFNFEFSHFQDPASRTGGSKEPDLVEGKAPLGEDCPHDPADLTCSSHDSDAHSEILPSLT